MDRGIWWATVHSVTKESDTTQQLKQQIPSVSYQFLLPCTVRLWKSLIFLLFPQFALVFVRDIALQFSFLVMSLPGFGFRIMMDSQKDQKILAHLLFPRNQLQRICTISFLNIYQSSPVKQSWLGASWFERLFKSDTISLAHIGLFKLSVSSCVNFGRQYLLRNWSVSSMFSNFQAQSCLQNSHYIFNNDTFLVIFSFLFLCLSFLTFPWIT